MFRIDGYNVDIDQASFGHQVVEIETMSGKGATEIASAGDGIAKLARSLLDQDEGSSTRPVKVKHTTLVLFPFLPNLTVIYFFIFFQQSSIDSLQALNQRGFLFKRLSTAHLAPLYASPYPPPPPPSPHIKLRNWRTSSARDCQSIS